MPTPIEIEPVDPQPSGTAAATFRVTVRGKRSTTVHRVTLRPEDFRRLRVGSEDETTFVRRCFDFLLERESNDSILSAFDVMVIARYFPEFERTIVTGSVV
jgi:hypothetical protein